MCMTVCVLCVCTCTHSTCVSCVYIKCCVCNHCSSLQDELVLSHWRRDADEKREYPYARFNKVQAMGEVVMCSTLVLATTISPFLMQSMSVLTYNEEEYKVCV